MTGRRFGEHLYRYDSVSSTQEVLKDLLRQGAPDGAMVVADSQTRGRGRRERSWHSPAGMGLWTSVAIYPQAPEEQWTWVSFWAGIAVRRAIVELPVWRDQDRARLRLKWPNDVLLDDRKLGGILAESVALKGNPALILGIGVNLRQSAADFPRELRDGAVSLQQVFGETPSPEDLAAQLTDQFEGLRPLLEPLNPGLIREIWLTHAWRLNQPLRVRAGDEMFSGVFTGLGEHGEILLTTDSGVKAFASLDLIEIPEDP